LLKSAGLIAALALGAADVVAQSFDVVAQTSADGKKSVVARVRPDDVSCASYAGGAWLGITRPTGEVWLEDSFFGRLVITAESIVSWRETRAKQDQEARERVAHAKAESALPQASKDLLAKYGDPTNTGVTVPAPKMVATYPPASVGVPQIQALNARLASLRVELEKQVPNVELVRQQFACLYQFERLPATLSVDGVSPGTTIESVNVPSPARARVKAVETRRASGADLARLFVAKPPTRTPGKKAP
jgi:hypothetical protein